MCYEEKMVDVFDEYHGGRYIALWLWTKRGKRERREDGDRRNGNSNTARGRRTACYPGDCKRNFDFRKNRRYGRFKKREVRRKRYFTKPGKERAGDFKTFSGK